MKPLTQKDEKQELEFVMMCLATVCGCGVLAEALRTVLAVMDYTASTADGWTLVIRAINLVVAGVCGALVFVILREVKRKQVFTRKNAQLVSCIGVAAVFGGIAQNVVMNIVYKGSTAQSGDMTYLILGLFILFVSCLFNIGIRMREEQELTV